jgi:hypothetical protein
VLRTVRSRSIASKRGSKAVETGREGLLEAGIEGARRINTLISLDRIEQKSQSKIT